MFVKVARRDEVGSGQVKLVVANGRKVALCNVGGSFFALDDACPHEGASLAEGDVEGDRLVCIFHGAAFDVRSGSLEDGPRCADAVCYPVRLTGDDVEVDA